MKFCRLYYITAFFSIIMALSIACSDADDIIDKKKENKQELDIKDIDLAISDYLKTQIDKVEISNPKAPLYKISIEPEDLDAERKKIWTLWKTLNKERFEDATNGGRWGKREDIFWNIPNKERMRIFTLSKGMMPKEGFPLFINLHGGGSYPYEPEAWSSSINTNEFNAIKDISERNNDAPSLYFIPRMSDDRRGRWYYLPQRYVYKRVFQLAALSDIVDINKIYLTGISEGGYGTERVALFMPDYFAAAAVLAASSELQDLGENLRNLPFRLEVGEYDNSYFRSKYANDWFTTMQKLKAENPNDFEHYVEVVKDRGHYLDYSKATPYMKSFSRNVYPNHISYIYHNIYPEGDAFAGGYVDALYYLDFRSLKRSSNKVRLKIDVRKDGNKYDINTSGVANNEYAGKVSGDIYLYLDNVDWTKNVSIRLNGKEVYNGVPTHSRGVMAESLALFGDPYRIFSAKVKISL